MAMLKFKPVACALFIAGVLTACGNVPVAPSYQRPAIQLPAEVGSAVASPIDFLGWWKLFNYPVLDALLQEAASQSQDLALASARIEEARATLKLNQANLYPIVDLNAAASRRRSSENSASANPSVNSYSSDLQI